MSLVERIDRGAICRLLLNQPSRLNVLSDTLPNALQEELDSVNKNNNILCCYFRSWEWFMQVMTLRKH